jgi:hypothetical protein
MTSNEHGGPNGHAATGEAVPRARTDSPRTEHVDQYVHHSHQLPEEASEATSRNLVRVVPLVYGGLLGGLGENLAFGLVSGVALGAAFDLYMGEHSIVRGLSRGLLAPACPAVAAVARLLSRLIQRLGVTPPAMLLEWRCRASRP